MERIQAWLSQAQSFRQRYGRPLVSLCYAQSLDGSLAARPGQPTPLSGPESSVLTHQLRAAHDAILVGIGTVLADDPQLIVRLAEGKSPRPVVLDSRLRTPVDARLLTSHPLSVWIATTPQADPHQASALQAAGARLLVLPTDAVGQVSLPALLECLASQGINSLMVEGGAQVIASFLSQRLADQVVVTIAPLFLGGLPAISQSAIKAHAGRIDASFPRLKDISYERLGDDLIVWGKIA
jgi:3,4-dihydroxy 2-butanone 4-phosphate synthase/GTP cyclohydrolase II